jgi:hypothetical protein
MPKSARMSAKSIENALASLPQHVAGLPARDSVTGVTAAADNQFTIIHTNEVDVYEKSGMPLAFAVVPAGDNFAGTARKAAKLSISTATTESFKDMKDLIKTLPTESKMISHNPPIGTGPTSKRVKEEDRNVHVTAFMYAASRENDNDFHVIIGRDPKATPEMYMMMEISGLPPVGSASFARLKAARDAFKKLFKDHGVEPPGLTYDFYQPPVPVQIDGSLFFDMTLSSGGRSGPPSLKSRMPVIWEVHPITVFKP